MYVVRNSSVRSIAYELVRRKPWYDSTLLKTINHEAARQNAAVRARVTAAVPVTFGWLRASDGHMMQCHVMV